MRCKMKVKEIDFLNYLNVKLNLNLNELDVNKDLLSSNIGINSYRLLFYIHSFIKEKGYSLSEFTIEFRYNIISINTIIRFINDNID